MHVVHHFPIVADTPAAADRRTPVRSDHVPVLTSERVVGTVAAAPMTVAEASE